MIIVHNTTIFEEIRVRPETLPTQLIKTMKRGSFEDGENISKMQHTFFQVVDSCVDLIFNILL